ncbi:putative esterase [Novymonas esmeraldas]|uniref:Esterase n=1 Tax=Novymonas esmeraldas TaxID=1808958 RepID=A0AAW0EQT2_9TRYP
MAASGNEALGLQALAHNPVNALHSKFCMKFDKVPVTDGQEGVTYDGDAAGTVHFAFAFPGATFVLLWTPQATVPLQPSPTAPGIWTATAQLPVGFRYVYVMVDSKDTLVPYLPIGYGYCRPVNFIDVPPPDMRSCIYAMRRGVEYGTVVHNFFDSSETSAVENLLVYLPPSYHKAGSAARRYPVLYLQHGLGENENGWVYHGKVNVIADNLIADGAMTEMIIVMGNGTMFENGEVSPEVYCRQLVSDIIPYIDNHYRTKADRDNRAIAGLSMGSMQTSRLCMTRHDLFAYAGVFSGFLRARWSGIGTADDDHIDVLRRDPAAFQAAMRVFFRCMGDDDTFRAVFEEDDALLADLGVACERRMYAGPHSWQVWRQAAADFLPLLFKGITSPCRR